MFFLGHSLIIINWMKFLTAIKRFILHKNPIHNIRDRGFQRLEQKNQVLHGTVTSADIDFSNAFMILIIITSFKICSAYSDSISTPSVFTTNDFFHL